MIRPLKVILPVVLGGLLAVAGISPAAANTISPGLPAGDPALWSVQTDIPYISSCSSQAGAIVQVGGWNQRGFFASGGTGTAPAGGYIPVSYELRELCVNPSGLWSFAIAVSPQQLTRASNQQFARMTLTITQVQCVRDNGSEYLSPANGLVISRLAGPSGTTASQSDFLETAVAATTFQAPCHRLVKAIGTVTRWNSFGVSIVTPVEWSAARWLGNEIYSNEPPPELLEWCELPENQDVLQCQLISPPNPAGWDDTCGDVGNADIYGVEYASFNPVDAETWGPATAWLAACLFVPLPDVGGFDRDGTAAAAWAESPNADVGDSLSTVASSFVYAPGCGQLGSTSAVGPLPSFSIDTCAWTWAEPVRNILGVGVLLGGFWWFITYVVRAVSGVLRKNVPSPVEGAGE